MFTYLCFIVSISWLILVPFKLTKTQVLICPYVDADSQRYTYKKVLRTYAANLHKRVTVEAFPQKLNAFSFHHTIDFAALFLLT